MKKLVVIPTDPIIAYEAKGLTKRFEYYNPNSYFDEVYIVSPFNEPTRVYDGLNIISIEISNYVEVINNIKPDIIRVYSSFLVADLACYKRLPNIPLIISVHDTVGISPSLLYADLIICMSSIVADKVKKIGVHDKSIIILPNRVDTDLFSKDKTNNILIRKHFPDGKMILCIGRQSHQKNIDTVIKALTLLPSVYFCVFIGKGSDFYQELARDLNVSERCFWIDSIKNNQLPMWYNACDCFCVPSRWEGFGVVFIEAAACNVPIITSNIAPMNEYLTNNVNSILVDDYENPARIADSILQLCENQELSERLSYAARSVALNFSNKLIDNNEARIYNDVLSNNILSKANYEYTDKESILYNLITKTGKNVLFGCSLDAIDKIKYLQSLGIEIDYFIDNNTSKFNNVILNKHIYPPSILKNKNDINAIILPNYHWLSMYEQLNNIGNFNLIDYNYIKIKYPVQSYIY